MKRLIYFTSKNCRPCAILGPIMNEVSNEVAVQKVDVDQDKALATQYGIRSVPTVLLVENNQEKGRLVGVQPKSRYIQLFNQF
jgi:thioredoxin 1